ILLFIVLDKDSIPCDAIHRLPERWLFLLLDEGLVRITNGRLYSEDEDEFSTLHLLTSSATVVKKNPERSRIRPLREGFHVLTKFSDLMEMLKPVSLFDKSCHMCLTFRHFQSF